MPRIREYTQQVSAAGPMQTRSASSEDFGGGTGLQQLGQAVGQVGDFVYKRAEQNEISDLTKTMAEVHSNFTLELQRETQQGTLDSEKFMQRYRDTVSRVRDSITTRGAELHFSDTAAKLDSHFLESAAASQSELAKAKAVSNYVTTQNTLSTSLINDPSSFKTALDLHTSGIDGLVANEGLPAQAAEKLKVDGASQLAKASVQGWIKLSPQEAKAQLDSGKWDGYFDSDTKQQMYGQIAQEENARRIERDRQLAEQEKILKKQQEEVEDQFLSKIQENALTPKEVLDNPILTSSQKEHNLRLIDAAAKKTLENDPAVFNNLIGRIHAKDGDPHKIVDDQELNPYIGRGLSIEGANMLRKEIRGSNTEQGKITQSMKKRVLDEARKALVNTGSIFNPIPDPQGQANYTAFNAFFLQEYVKQRQAGKSDAELLDPNSKDYLGQYIRTFQRTPQQIMQDMSKNSSPVLGPLGQVGTPLGPRPLPGQPGNKSVEPRKDGESAADYLKRVGGK